MTSSKRTNSFKTRSSLVSLRFGNLKESWMKLEEQKSSWCIKSKAILRFLMLPIKIRKRFLKLIVFQLSKVWSVLISHKLLLQETTTFQDKWTSMLCLEWDPMAPDQILLSKLRKETLRQMIKTIQICEWIVVYI